MPVFTSYKAFTKRFAWNEWIVLPMQFCDLPRTAYLCLTIYDCGGPGRLITVGGTTISLFGNHGIFCEGMYDLRIWPNVEADGESLEFRYFEIQQYKFSSFSGLNYPTTTPGKGSDFNENQMQRLAKLAKKHRNGEIQKIDWLDRLTFREIEVINEKEKRESEFYLYLMIEFPKIEVEEKVVSSLGFFG